MLVSYYKATPKFIEVERELKIRNGLLEKEETISIFDDPSYYKFGKSNILLSSIMEYEIIKNDHVENAILITCISGTSMYISYDLCILDLLRLYFKEDELSCITKDIDKL